MIVLGFFSVCFLTFRIPPLGALNSVVDGALTPGCCSYQASRCSMPWAGKALEIMIKASWPWNGF